MPRTRQASGHKSTSGAAATSKAKAKGGKQQQPISFGGVANRVTKPSAASRSQESKKAETKARALERAGLDTEGSQHSVGDNSAVHDIKVAEATPAGTELTIREQVRADGDDDEEEEVEEDTALLLPPPPPQPQPPTREEEEAGRLPEAQIKRYWAAKEAERRAPRVHQAGLTLHDKILREFDMSSQFGTCAGVARVDRWKLAHELGLAPPIEVLAVLVREAAEGNAARVKRAYVDELMSSRFVVD